MANIPIVTLIMAYHTLTSVVCGYYIHPRRNCTGTDCSNYLLQRPKINLEQQKTLRIEMIRKQILSKLRMHERPNITKSIPRVAFHKALQKLKLRDPKLRSRGVTEDYYAQISEIVSFSEEGRSSLINLPVHDLEAPRSGSQCNNATKAVVLHRTELNRPGSN
jgi:hypothetical protein